MMNLLRRLRRPPADCRAVGRRLQAYLDGEIDDDRRADIAAHLEACRACGLEFATYLEIKHSLERERPDVSPEALERLRRFGRDISAGAGPSADDGTEPAPRPSGD